MTGITQQPEKSHSITDAFHLFGFKSSPKKEKKLKDCGVYETMRCLLSSPTDPVSRVG